MKILVAGASGFTGKRVVSLLAQKAEVYAFARDTSDLSAIEDQLSGQILGNFFDSDTLTEALEGMDGFIMVGSMGFGHAPHVVQAVEKSQVRRCIFLSSTAIFTSLPAKTKKVRKEAEDLVMASQLDWTILRPTMIYGDKDDRNMIRLLRFLKRFPVVPIPGNGKSLQQPIYVEDLAQAIVDAFFSEKTIRKAYNLSGAQPLDFNTVIDLASSGLKLKRAKWHIPLWLIRPIVNVYETVIPNPRIKSEQLDRLNENKAFDHQEAKNDFGFSPRDYKSGIEQEIERVFK